MRSRRWCTLLAFVAAALSVLGATADAREPAAIGTLDRALDGAPRAARGRCLEVVYRGELDLAGHYARPGLTRRFHSLQRLIADGRGAVRLDWTTWAEGDSAGAPESFLVRGDSVFHRDAPERAWRLLAGERAEQARFQAFAGLPWEFCRDRRMAARVSGMASAAARSGRAALAAEIAGRTRTLSLGEGGRVETIEDLRAHPRLGDVTDRVAASRGSGLFPDSIAVTLHERDHEWTLHQRRISARTDAPAASFDPGPGFEPAAAEPDTAADWHIVEVGPGAWAAEKQDLDTRSLIVEFADHLAVIECAVGSVHGERLVDAIQRRWPAKPIRYALFSHHHPHYTGGLRALIAAGARVVTTPGNERFVRELARRPFRIAPDRLARAPVPVEVGTFTGRHELVDVANRLVLVDIGARSDHTDEFVVFWLPLAGLVFETEQGWLTAGGELRAGRRAEGFLGALADAGIEPERLLQSWPMRGTERELTRARLLELIAARPR